MGEGMSNNFRVGQKVVCISKDEEWALYDASGTRLGTRRVGYGQVFTCTGFCDEWSVPAITLEGFPREAFHAAFFRPAVERGTDTGMAILTKILKDDLVLA